MSVSCVNLTHGNNVAGVSSCATASITPIPRTPTFINVTSRTSANDPNHATVTGCGITWTEVLSVNYDNSGSQKRLTVLRGIAAAPTTGTLTIDFASQTQTDIAWVVDTMYSSVMLSGADAVVQTASNTDTAGTNTTLTATLGAFSNPNNATYGVCAIGQKSLTFTPGTGFTKIGEDEAALNGVHIATEFRVDNSTSVGFTTSVAGELAVIAIEVKPYQTPIVINRLRPKIFTPGIAR